MQTEKCYAVLIGLKSGYPCLAADGKGAPAIFGRKHRALCFRDELLKEGRVKGRVVRVEVSYEIPK